MNMAGYNRTRYVEQLLEKTESSPPSFTVHLHPEYWVLNNGSKFLYHNQIASLLDDIRAHRIPVDFLELFKSARVPFYDGCMVVELLDYRPQKSKEPAPKNPEKTRVILHPNPETLWADVCSLNQRHGGKWTDMDALEVEAKLLLATSQPLCLDPDPHLTRIVNHVLRVSTPSMPLSLKRKASALEPEEDGPEKAKKERLLGFMAPRENRSHAPTYRLLDAIHASRQKTDSAKVSSQSAQPGNQYMAANSQPQPPQSQPTPVPSTPTPVAPSPSDTSSGKTKKIETPQAFNVAFRPNGSHTPVPPQPTHQFVNQNPMMASAPTSNMQAQVYANVQAAKDAANSNRAPTPAQQLQQQQYMQHYQMQQQQSSPPQPAQSQLPRPPSQPQHPQVQNSVPQISQSSPQQPQQQLNAAQFQAQQQRFTQSPKPPAQATSATPTHANATPQQQFGGATSGFQAAIPNQHNQQFLQPPPPGIRSNQKSIQQTGQQPLPYSLPPNATPQQIAQAQQQHALYARVAQQKAAAAAANGGRATPQVQVQQSPRTQAQALQQAGTPSPARSSPIVNHQSVAAARASPMPAKAPIPIQQNGALGVGVGQQQSQVPGTMPQRMLSYNPHQLRPVIHGNTQMAQAQGGVNGVANPGGVTVNATPTMAHASPGIGAGGRPMTPGMALGSDGKPPMRRPTPMQQQQHAQMQAQAQAVAQAQKHQTPQAQSQQLPQVSPAQGQAQLAQGQPHAQAQTQVQQTPVQQQTQITTQQQQQQMAAYAQMYAVGGGYHPLWRVQGQQQQQQHTGAATGQSQIPTAQQHQLQLITQQIVQQAQQTGQQITPQQIQFLAVQRLMQQQQLQAQAQGGGQVAVQGGQAQVSGQQQQQHMAQVQAMMLMRAHQAQVQQQQAQAQAQAQSHGQMQMQQMQQQQQAVAAQAQAAQHAQAQAGQHLHMQLQMAAHAAAKGKPGAGKGVIAKKGPAGQR